MPLLALFSALIFLSLVGFWLAHRSVILKRKATGARWHSLPLHYGFYVALWTAVPAAVLMIGWLVMESWYFSRWIVDLYNLGDIYSKGEQLLYLDEITRRATDQLAGAPAENWIQEAAAKYRGWIVTSHRVLGLMVLVLAVLGFVVSYRRVAPNLKARNVVERFWVALMFVASTIAILTTVGIIFSLLFEALRFFARVPILEFIFGLTWSPHTALRADQVGASGAFGAVPLFVGTLLVTVIAMAVAVPVGLYSAIYLAEYSGPRTRTLIKPLLEILAGIPTVVYGVFAALTVAPFFRDTGEAIGLQVSSESALAAGLVMGVMIIPFVSSLSDDVMNAVPQNLRDGSYALGATKAETIRRVVVPAALPGIFGAVLLAVSRAIGETMIVIMAAGLAANLTLNPLESVSTVTVQIVTLLVGDQEFESARTLAVFGLGLVLFCATLLLNIAALAVVRKYREKYD